MIWLICIIAFILIVLLLPVSVTAKYEYSAEEKQNIFKVTVFGIKVFTFDAYAEKKEKDKKEKPRKEKEKKKFTYEDFRSLADNWEKESADIRKNAGKLFHNLRMFANLKVAECRLDFGFDDAAKTGIAAGVAYGIVYNAFAKLYYYFNIRKKNLNVAVNPDFTKERMELYLRFTFRARLLFAFLAAADIIKIYLALVKK